MSADPTGYPRQREVDVALRDGSTVHVRPVRAEDEEPLREFLEDLSLDSRVLRFFGAGTNLRMAAHDAADVNYCSRYGVLATLGADARIVAHAEYIGSGDDTAEVAFEVGDAAQGMGLGTILLAHLAEAAVENGIETFQALVLPQNHRMIEVFRESGFAPMVRSLPDAVAVEFPTSVSPEAIEAFERRDQVAAAAAVRRFFAPRSVAVIGASRRAGSVGAEIFRNLIAAGFNGPVYPVNPEAPRRPVGARLRLRRGDPGCRRPRGDRRAGKGGARRRSPMRRKAGGCAHRDIGRLCRDRRERRPLPGELLSICRESGMRLIGPNCLGTLNTSADVKLNATFSPSFPSAGRVGFMSQSGALGLALIDRAQARGIGLSSFASVGNKADVSGNDLLQYWETDQARASSCSTWSRSATRGGLRGSLAASVA